MKSFQLLRWWAGAVAFGLIGSTHGIHGASVVYTIDPARSAVTLSGTVAGGTIKEQGPGSLTTKFQGTLQAELNSDSLQFAGGSQINAQTNGSWEPLANGAAGSAPANYGGNASVTIVIFTVTAKAALRNVQFDAFSGLLPLANGQFDSSGLLFQFPTNASAVLDYAAGSLKSGHKDLAGYSTNKVTTAATLVSTGGVETLTIPIDASQTFELLAPNDSLLVLKGQLVATRSAVPALRIGSISVSNQVVTLQWPSSPGQKFLVTSSSDLKTWTTRATGLTATGATMTWSTNAAPKAEFYRLGQ